MWAEWCMSHDTASRLTLDKETSVSIRGGKWQALVDGR